MSEVKIPKKQFHVKLSEREVRTILEIVEVGCLRFMVKSEKAKHKISALLATDPYGSSPEFKQLSNVSIESENKFHTLEAIEKHLSRILKGKTRGRRGNVSPYESRFRDFSFIQKVQEVTKKEEQLCKL